MSKKMMALAALALQVAFTDEITGRLHFDVVGRPSQRTRAPSIIERVASGPVRSLEMLPQRESKRAARRARGRSKGARG